MDEIFSRISGLTQCAKNDNQQICFDFLEVKIIDDLLDRKRIYIEAIWEFDKCLRKAVYNTSVLIR